MSNRTKKTPQKTKKFLDSIRSGNSVTTAAKQLNIRRQTAYTWRDEDDEFRQQWNDAVEEGTDALEEEAVRRALNGSDTMLIFLLKGNRGEKYKEKWQGELTGKGGGPIEFSDTERAAKLASVLSSAKNRQEDKDAE